MTSEVDPQKIKEEKILSTKDLGHEKILQLKKVIKELGDLTESYAEYSQFIKNTSTEEDYNLYLGGKHSCFCRKEIGLKIREMENLIRQQQNVIIDAENYLRERSPTKPVDIIC